MRVWLDTDLGSDVDDALALAYVLRRPELELVGVSTVFGDIPLRVDMVQALLAMTDGPAVPVLAGLGVPLTERRHGVMFGHEGRGLLVGPNPMLRVREEDGAEARMEALASAVDDAAPDVMVAIGPLSNIGALAVAGSGSAARRLPPLAIMGGKLRDVMLPGMVSYVSEWNWFCDPISVQNVLAAQHPASSEAGDHQPLPTVIPAEVTFLTRLSNDDIDLLADGDELNRCLGVLCREWLRAQAEILNVEDPRVALHDPLTAAILVEPNLCEFENRRIEVDDRGATTAVDGAPNVRAAVSVDADEARRHVMATLTGVEIPK